MSRSRRQRGLDFRWSTSAIPLVSYGRARFELVAQPERGPRFLCQSGPASIAVRSR